MNISSLKSEAMQLIKNPSVQDASLLARLAPIPDQLDQLQRQQETIDRSASMIKEFLTQVSKGSGSAVQVLPPKSNNRTTTAVRKARQKIRIRIDWPSMGKPLQPETIFKHKASDTLAIFITRLWEVLGEQVLERLSEFRVSRGPLLSKAPDIDYGYRSRTGMKVYRYHPVGTSGYYVLTGTETSQKVDDILQACKCLGLPSGAITAESVDKSAMT